MAPTLTMALEIGTSLMHYDEKQTECVDMQQAKKVLQLCKANTLMYRKIFTITSIKNKKSSLSSHVDVPFSHYSKIQNKKVTKFPTISLVNQYKEVNKK